MQVSFPLMQAVERLVYSGVEDDWEALYVIDKHCDGCIYRAGDDRGRWYGLNWCDYIGRSGNGARSKICPSGALCTVKKLPEKRKKAIEQARPKRRKMTIAEFMEFYNSGLNDHQIARAVGYNPKSIQRIRGNLGLKANAPQGGQTREYRNAQYIMARI